MTDFQKYSQDQITDDVLQEAAELFSNHYGVWAKRASKCVRSKIEEGSHVKMNKRRLQAECLPAAAAENSYTRATIDGQLVGNALACRWKHGDKVVCWVTQLVVHRDYRRRGLALKLLRELMQKDDNIYGITSSHPAACIAAARAFGRRINEVQVTFIRDQAEEIMKSSPVNYINGAKLRGSLFDSTVNDGTISSVDTQFFVDHTEPLEILGTVRNEIFWPLGELVDGHEFLLILEAWPFSEKLPMLSPQNYSLS